MRKVVCKGQYLTMSTENVDGHVYERVTLRSGIRVVPVQDDKILFIREYRTHEKHARLKLIGGWIDKDDKTVLEIAQDELREEVSLKARDWSLFYTYNTPSQIIEEKVDYFIAKDLTQLPKQQNPDSDIVEEIVFFTEEDVKNKLSKREILWDKDMVVVMMFFHGMRNK